MPFEAKLMHTFRPGESGFFWWCFGAWEFERFIELILIIRGVEKCVENYAK